MDYINNVANEREILQFMIFTDDSAEIQFKDHTSVQLSPCGANFQYLKSMEGCPGVPDYRNIIRQRCRFATSETKGKVELALTLRNLFASRPYMPAQFLHTCKEGKVHLYKDVTSFYWPAVTDKGNLVSSDQSVAVTAKEDSAMLTLANSGQLVSVSFLAKISPCTSRNPTPAQSPRGDKASGPNHVESAGRREYVWMKHIFPPHICPKNWEYPLGLAQSVKSKSDGMKCLLDVSHAPRPLPSVCKNQFKHKWRSNEDLRSQAEGELVLPENDQNSNLLRILWNNQTLYWISFKQHVKPALNVWLQDGSLLYSTSATKYYFQHQTFDQLNGNIEMERTYCPTALPRNAELKTILLRSIRLLSYIEQNRDFHSTTKNKLCWHDPLSYELVSDSLYPSTNQVGLPTTEITIPSLGRFSSVSGSAQVTFNDGASVYVSISTEEYTTLKASPSLLERLSWRLRLTDCTYESSTDLLHYDSRFSGYLQPVADWLLWLANSPDQRAMHPFYSDTIYSTDKLTMVADELEKINSFNSSQNTALSDSGATAYLEVGDGSYNSAPEKPKLNNNNVTSDLLKFQLNTSCGDVCPADIARALSNTSKAISDIDNVLNTWKVG